MVMGYDANKPTQQYSQGMYVDVRKVPIVSEFEEWHDLILSIAVGLLLSESLIREDEGSVFA